MSERARRTPRTARPPRIGRSTAGYRQLTSPFEPSRVLSDDHVAHLHASALRLLQEHGIRVLLPEARAIFAAAGATIGQPDDDAMVRIPSEVVEAALATAPSTVSVAARNAEREMTMGGRSMAFLPVAGPPYVSDLDRGRRPGTLVDFENFVRLSQHFDVIHSTAPSVEAQDVPIEIRHLQTTKSMITLTDKPLFAYSRGRRILEDTFELVRIANGVTPDQFTKRA